MKIHMFGLFENAWLPGQPVMRILRMGGLPTKSSISQVLLTIAN